MSECTTVAIEDLAPTQLTVGMREVDWKRLRWREKHSCRAVDYLSSHRFPVILGPNARYYLIDRHHLALALHEEGILGAPVSIVADMSVLSPEEFWTALERQNCTHPYDDRGIRRSYDEMPKAIDGLIDDPYRSLAGALKRAGGYAKDNTPFSEFRWADYLRCRISREFVDRHFGRALALAANLAHGADAISLPGWRRHPTDETV